MKKKIIFILLLNCVCFILQAQKLVPSFEDRFFKGNSETISLAQCNLRPISKTLFEVERMQPNDDVFLWYRSHEALVYILKRNYEFCMDFYFVAADDKVYCFSLNNMDGSAQQYILTPAYSYLIKSNQGFLKIYENSKEMLNCFCYRLGNQMSIIPFEGTNVQVWDVPKKEILSRHLKNSFNKSFSFYYFIFH